jgi:hypothetical protein
MNKITKLLTSVLTFDGFSHNRKTPTWKEVVTERTPPPGCSEYAFNNSGKFSRDGFPKMLRADVAFKCIALNDRNARRKFSNWKVKNIFE